MCQLPLISTSSTVKLFSNRAGLAIVKCIMRLDCSSNWLEVEQLVYLDSQHNSNTHQAHQMCDESIPAGLAAYLYSSAHVGRKANGAQSEGIYSSCSHQDLAALFSDKVFLASGPGQKLILELISSLSVACSALRPLLYGSEEGSCCLREHVSQLPSPFHDSLPYVY